MKKLVFDLQRFAMLTVTSADELQNLTYSDVDTIIFGADIDLGGVSLEVDKNITIDLNKHTLTSSAQQVINVAENANLNLKNGTINDTDYHYGIKINEGGTLVVDDVAINSNNTAIYNEGTCTFNSGSINDNDSTQTMIENAIYNEGTLNINGGKIVGGHFGMIRNNGGNVIIDGGVFDGDIGERGIDNWSSSGTGSVKINAGTFSFDVSNYVDVDSFLTKFNDTYYVTTEKPIAILKDTLYYSLENAVGAASADDTIIIINDADIGSVTINKNVTLDLNGKNIIGNINAVSEVNIIDVEKSGSFTGNISGKVNIKDGIYSVDVSKYVDTDDCSITQAEGKYKVGQYVAEVGGTKYISLQDAFNAAANDTVTLINNAAVRSKSIAVVNSFILDLNGHKIYNSLSTETPIINGNDSNTITIKDSVGNGEIVGSGECGVYFTRGTINIESGTIIGKSSGVESTYGEINVSGGTIIGEGCGAYAIFDGSTLNISGGVIKGGYYGARSGWGEVNISGGNITGEYNGVNNGWGVINVFGGTITGSNQSLDNTYGTISVVGGTFNSDVSAYVNSDDATITNDGTNYIVTPKYEAIIGNTKYSTLAEAVSAASSGDTITLIKDVNLSSLIKFEKNLNLNLNGHNIASDKTAFWITTSGNLTINDTKGDGTISGAGSIANSGILTINGGKISKSGTGINNSGALTINGGVIDAGSDAIDNWKGKFTITDTSFSVNGSSSDGASLVTINGGTIKSGYRAICNYNPGTSAIINGGNISGELTNGVTINGGTFDSPYDNCLVNDELTFKSNGDGTYTVVTASEPVAKIGDVEYCTLAAAVNAAQNSDTITLIADIYSNVAVNKNINIDLNNHSITSFGTPITINSGGNLTVKNGTINALSTNYGSSGIHVNSGTTLYVDNVNFNAQYKGINNGGTVNFLNGTINSNLYAFENTGTFNITDGIFDALWYPNNGTLSVNGGTYTFDVTDYLTDGHYVAHLNGEYIVSSVQKIAAIGNTFYTSFDAALNAAKSGDTIILVGDVNSNINISKNITLDLNGCNVVGDINSTGSLKIINTDTEGYYSSKGSVTGNLSGNISISGGNYSTDVSSFVNTDDCKITEYDGQYRVEQYIAEIDGDKYTDLSRISMIAYDNTVKLLADVVSSSEAFYFHGNAIIDLNGHSVTTTSNSRTAISSMSSLTIKDSVGGGSINSRNNAVDVRYGTLTIEGGTINGKLNAEDDSITITGGIFNYDISDYVAEGVEIAISGDKYFVGKDIESIDTVPGGIDTIASDKEDTPTGSQLADPPTSTTTDTLTYNELTKKVKTHTAVTLGSGWSGTLNGSDYDSTVKNIHASNSNGALYIVGNSNANLIQGGIGNNTLNGGGGNDTLTGSSGKDVFIYSSGDGKDIITDYSAGEDVIKIASGSITKATVSKNNVVLTVGKGSITLKDAKNKKITVIDSNENASTQLYGSKSISIADGDGQTLNTSLNSAAVTLDSSSRTTNLNLVGNSKANMILLGTGNTTLTTGKGKDTIEYKGGNIIVSDYTVKQDKIRLDSAKVIKAETSGSDVKFTTDKGTLTINNTSGKQITFINGKSSVNYFVNGTATIKGGNAADTITGGSENDLMTGGKGADVFIYSGGNDTISDYNPAQKDVIQLSGVTFDTYSTSGKNAILTFKDSDETLTIINAKDKIANIDGLDKTLNDIHEKIFTKKYSASSYVADNDVVTINAAANSSAINITGNLKDNLIKGSVKNDTIDGNSGKNTITGGKGKDFFIYAGLSDDTITDYTAGQDSVSLIGGVKFKSATYEGKNLIFTAESGKTLTLQNVINKKNVKQKVTIIDNGITTSQVYGDSSIVVANADCTTLDATTSINGNLTTIDASKRKSAIYIIGNSNSNTIKGGSGNDTLKAGSGSTVILGNKGNDTIFGGSSDNTINSGAGNDIINLAKSHSKATIVYTAGNDKVTDFNLSDVVSLANGVTATASRVNDNEYTLTLKKGKTKLGTLDISGNSAFETISSSSTSTNTKKQIATTVTNYFVKIGGVSAIYDTKTETTSTVTKAAYSERFEVEVSQFDFFQDNLLKEDSDLSFELSSFTDYSANNFSILQSSSQISLVSRNSDFLISNSYPNR